MSKRSTYTANSSATLRSHTTDDNSRREGLLDRLARTRSRHRTSYISDTSYMVAAEGRIKVHHKNSASVDTTSALWTTSRSTVRTLVETARTSTPLSHKSSSRARESALGSSSSSVSSARTTRLSSYADRTDQTRYTYRRSSTRTRVRSISRSSRRSRTTSRTTRSVVIVGYRRYSYNRRY